MRRAVFIAGTIMAVSVAGTGAAMAAGGGQEAADEAAYTQAHRAEAVTTEKAATQAATARHPGTVVDTHLQNEGTLVWELVMSSGGARWEVQVDARSGEVVSDQTDE